MTSLYSQENSLAGISLLINKLTVKCKMSLVWLDQQQNSITKLLNFALDQVAPDSIGRKTPKIRPLCPHSSNKTKSKFLKCQQRLKGNRLLSLLNTSYHVPTTISLINNKVYGWFPATLHEFCNFRVKYIFIYLFFT